MKLSLICTAAAVGVSAAFSPSATVSRSNVALNMNADQSTRKAFLSAAVATGFVAVLTKPAFAATMAQENISDPTETWETGSPSADAAAARKARYANARTQQTSNFAPQKRLTLERKSPVQRIDISAPNFAAYKRTFPGLYKTVEEAKQETGLYKPAEEPPAESKVQSKGSKADAVKSAE